MSTILVASAILLTTAFAAEASTNGIAGQPLDPRITRCGITIEGKDMAVFRPFIETSDALSGKIQVLLTKKSAGGNSTIRQASGFSHGSLGNIRLVVDRPSAVALKVTVTDTAGQPLCSIDADFDI